MKKNTFSPFYSFSSQLQSLLNKASNQKNPALWLHNNNGRTTIFMLEALTRLHKNAFDEKVFDKWNKRFKKLEDVFGDIDQYSSLEAELKLNKKVSKEVLKYFNVQASNSINKCNQRLIEKEWLDNKLEVFNLKLSEFDVNYNKEYADELKEAMMEEIESILIFAEKSNYHLTKIEEEIHELRRKLRWLSIYAQALNGLVQLKQSTKRKNFEIDYFIRDILKSPYNIMPKKPQNASVLWFDSDSFFALSWLINDLGKLKDQGLKIQQLSDAIFITEEISREQATVKAIAILGFKKDVQDDILKQASLSIMKALSKDKILNSLVI